MRELSLAKYFRKRYDGWEFKDVKEDAPMRIAICEDEEYQRKTIEDYIRPYQENYLSMQIFSFASGEDLLNAFHKGCDFDFLFLDIQMKALDGVQAAAEIRKKNKHAIIFFVSGFTQYVTSAFSLNAFQFLVKPVRKDSFDREFQRAIRKHMTAHHKYLIESNSRTVALEIKDIIYLEISNHHIVVHTDKGEYVKAGKLNEEEKSLVPYGFVRTHNSFLVNMAYIVEFIQNEVIMKNGSKPMVSARKRTEALGCYSRFLTGSTL